MADSRLHLLLVADDLGGGLGTSARSQAEWFSRHGRQVLLTHIGTRATLPPVGIEVVDLPRVSSAFDLRSLLAAARDLRRVLRQFRPRVVHAHGTRSQLVCLLAGRRPYVTMHGSGGRVEGQGLLGSTIRSSSRRLAARLAVVAFSAAPAPGRWRTLVHASPRLGELEMTAIPRDAVPTMVWIGRLDHPKQPQAFVEACALAARTVPLRGMVVGDGPLRAHVEQRIAELEAPVDMAGSVDDIGAVLGRARALCLLSGFEGVPFAVQEAMWAGRPVVLSPLPSMRWFAAEQARWATDAQEAAEAFVALTDWVVAVAEGKAAAQRVRAVIEPDAPFPELLAVYEGR